VPGDVAAAAGAGDRGQHRVVGVVAVATVVTRTPRALVADTAASTSAAAETGRGEAVAVNDPVLDRRRW
jgi:hypothetical protein